MTAKSAQIELTEGSIKGAVKHSGGGSADLWKVPPGALRVLKGFNVRIVNDAYRARVEHLKALIRENQYLIEHPMTGYAAVVDGEHVIYVTGGHRRLQAVMELIAEGVPLEFVSVVIPKGRDMVDLTAAMYLGNDSEPLQPYETAVLCKRMVGFGLDSAQIAKRLNFASAQYVDGLLMLVAAPLAVQKLVTEGVTAATTVIEALRKHGDKAQDILLKAVVTAGQGKRVTAKNLPDAAFRKSLKKAGEPMYNALTTLTCDPAFNKLSLEVKTAIGEALALIAKK